MVSGDGTVHVHLSDETPGPWAVLVVHPGDHLVIVLPDDMPPKALDAYAAQVKEKWPDAAGRVLLMTGVQLALLRAGEGT